jgi:hypothetical protein
MARIEVEEAQAWVEGTKLGIIDFDANLLDQVETQVLGRIGTQFNTSTWVSPETTPKMVRTIIAMFYVAWFYDRQYSEEQEAGNDYAALLRAQAEGLLAGVLDNSIDLPEVPGDGGTSDGPSFYPTDASSALEPTYDDPSLGPAAFSMGTKF